MSSLELLIAALNLVFTLDLVLLLPSSLNKDDHFIVSNRRSIVLFSLNGVKLVFVSLKNVAYFIQFNKMY